MTDLAAENTALRERVAELENEISGMRFPWRRALLATDNQLTRLLSIALPVHPRLIPAVPDHDFMTSLRQSFAWLSTMRRTPTPNRSRYLDHWSDVCTAWCRANGAGGGDVDRALFTAAILWGDVPYLVSTMGVPPALGLHEHQGAPATPLWRQVLAGTRRLRPPDAPPPLAEPRAPRAIHLDVARDYVGRVLRISNCRWRLLTLGAAGFVVPPWDGVAFCGGLHSRK